ncbi:fungal hydrophobin-domain-containing protein [Daedaleopsis nitida]|nr:fungal hydrophobin-domain-containing protein [Daedaleopsis nitida]
MKFTYAIAAVVAAAASVQATETIETNAQRLAHGLNPLPPRSVHHRASRTDHAKRASPSGTSSNGSCNTGPVQCCQQVSQANDNVISSILGFLNIVTHPDALIGLQCSPLSVVGAGGGSCRQRTVCCENNSHGGLISIGCIPIML